MTHKTTVRFTEPQLELFKRAMPDSNLAPMTELSFVFNPAGKLIDCCATGADPTHDYSGPALVALYTKAQHRFVASRAQKGSATILQFPASQTVP